MSEYNFSLNPKYNKHIYLLIVIFAIAILTIIYCLFVIDDFYQITSIIMCLGFIAILIMGRLLYIFIKDKAIIITMDEKGIYNNVQSLFLQRKQNQWSSISAIYEITGQDTIYINGGAVVSHTNQLHEKTYVLFHQDMSIQSYYPSNKWLNDSVDLGQAIQTFYPHQIIKISAKDFVSIHSFKRYRILMSLHQKEKKCLLVTALLFSVCFILLMLPNGGFYTLHDGLLGTYFVASVTIIFCIAYRVLTKSRDINKRKRLANALLGFIFACIGTWLLLLIALRIFPYVANEQQMTVNPIISKLDDENIWHNEYGTFRCKRNKALHTEKVVPIYEFATIKRYRYADICQ